MTLDQACAQPTLADLSTSPSRTCAIPAVNEVEEDAIVARASNGDRNAMDLLINRYRVRAVRLADQILQHSGEAEDAAQDAFIKAFKRLPTYRSDGKFYTWLYTIVVRECLNRKRSAWWKSEVGIELAEPELNSSSGTRSMQETDLTMVVDQLLKKLKPDMRAMIVLRELEGMEYADIAKIMNIPTGRVKWRIHTARLQFRALWSELQRETNDVSSS